MDSDFFKQNILNDAFKNCKPLNCEISNDKNKRNEARALIFSIPRILKPWEFGRYNLKRNSSIDQLYIGWSMESSQIYPNQSDNEFIKNFNITAGYKRNDNIQDNDNESSTHIYIPYGPIPFSLTSHYARSAKFGDQKSIPKKRENSILFISGNCKNEKIGRFELVQSLMNLTNKIDSYGKCLHNKDLEIDYGYNVDKRAKQKLSLLKNYNFILSIENSRCDDYVTEKLWEPLSVGTIPIYLGAPNVDEFLPSPNSIINIANFKSAKSLLEYIESVENNEELRLKHLDWITKPLPQKMIDKITESKNNLDLFCNLCKKINYIDKNPTVNKLLPNKNPFGNCIQGKFNFSINY